MKKLLLITLAVSMLISGCGGNKSTSTNTEKNNDKYGLTLTLENITATGLDLICKQKDVTFEGELKISGCYKIETSDEQDSWKEVEIVGPFCETEDIYHTINKNSTTEFNLAWDDIYGELPKGKYRIHLFMRHYITEDSINKAEYFRYFEIQ